MSASHNFVTEPIRVRLPSGKQVGSTNTFRYMPRLTIFDSDPQPITFNLSGHGYPAFVGPSSPFNFLLDVPVSSLDLVSKYFANLRWGSTTD